MHFINSQRKNRGITMYISKTKLVLTGILVASLIMIVTADSQRLDPVLTQGQHPYTPTRLEWLSVKLNALETSDDVVRDGYAISYVPDPYHKNTIQIHCYYIPDQTNETNINEIIRQSQELTMAFAKNYGWDSWIKTKEIITSSQR